MLGKVSPMSTVANKIIGGLLRDIRCDKGLSQSQVAARCGIRQPLVSKIEHGDRVLSACEILPYAVALGVNDERLYYEIRKALLAYARQLRAAKENA